MPDDLTLGEVCFPSFRETAFKDGRRGGWGEEISFHAYQSLGTHRPNLVFCSTASFQTCAADLFSDLDVGACSF